MKNSKKKLKNEKITKTAMTTRTLSNYAFAKYVRHTHNPQYNIHNECFVILKQKGKPFDQHEKVIYTNEDGVNFLNLKTNLFKGRNLEAGKVYALSIDKMGNYKGNDYIKRIGFANVSEKKQQALLEKYDKQEEQIQYEIPDSSDEDEEEPKPKSKKTKTKKAKKTKTKRKMKQESDDDEDDE